MSVDHEKMQFYIAAHFRKYNNAIKIPRNMGMKKIKILFGNIYSLMDLMNHGVSVSTRKNLKSNFRPVSMIKDME